MLKTTKTQFIFEWIFAYSNCLSVLLFQIILRHNHNEVGINCVKQSNFKKWLDKNKEKGSVFWDSFAVFAVVGLLLLKGPFSWVWHQMSQRLSEDFDGSISPLPAIPWAFICLSLTTVCLPDRLAAHSHLEASAQPCSSPSTKLNDHNH